jgi:hypothetical protein
MGNASNAEWLAAIRALERDNCGDANHRGHRRRKSCATAKLFSKSEAKQEAPAKAKDTARAERGWTTNPPVRGEPAAR